MEETPAPKPETSYAGRDHEEAAAWLRHPDPIDDNMVQDFDLIFPGSLDGGIVGHLRFYLQEEIPNPEKKLFLLNSIYFLSWTQFVGSLRDRWWSEPLKLRAPVALPDEMGKAVNLAQSSGNPELTRWAADVCHAAQRRRRPKYHFWCSGGWPKDIRVVAASK